MPGLARATSGSLQATKEAHRVASDVAYPPTERPIPEPQPSPFRNILPIEEYREPELVAPMNNVYTALAFFGMVAVMLGLIALFVRAEALGIRFFPGES